MKKIFVTGNVGRDPEQRADQNGNSFVTFSMGVSVGTKQAPKTDWVEVSCNGRLADVAKSYVKKGSKLLVEGFPSVNAYLNRDNQPVGTLRIYANNFEFVGGRRDEDGGHDSQQSSGSSDQVYDLPESGVESTHSSLQSDDIPF